MRIQGKVAEDKSLKKTKHKTSGLIILSVDQIHDKRNKNDAKSYTIADIAFCDCGPNICYPSQTLLCISRDRRE